MTGRKTIANAPSGENTSLAGTEKVPISGNQFTLISTIASYIRTLAQTLTNKTINLANNTLTGTTAEFNTALSDGNFVTLAGSEVLTNKTLTAPTIADFTNAAHDHGDADDGGALSSPTITTPTISGAITFPDNVTQTFNPGADNAGINVGSIAGDPATPDNGDLWYDSTANELTARINGSNVALGAGGGSSDSFKTIAVSGQSDVVADSSTDTLTLAAGSNITITTNAGTDTITIAGGAGTDVATDALWDAKGDLAVGTGANTAAKLTAGTNGYILSANSAQSTGLEWIANSASANHSYHTYAAAQLEPLAIEALQSGAFSYSVGAGATKIALNVFDARLGASGRWEVRDPRYPVPLRNVTVTGLASDAVGVFIDPAAPTYTDARDTFLDRLETLYTTAPKYLDLAATNTHYIFLPGPYGSIITSIAIFDLTWLVIRPYAATLGWNLSNEIGDTGSSDYQRVAHGCNIPVSKLVAARILTGGERSAGVGKGSITWINCPSTWGKVTDSTSYDFRDDFMGTSLDTATKWTRTQSTAGNVEINTTYNWCKLQGNAGWGTNGMFSQTGVSRASGKIFMCDLYINANSPDVVVGWHDGAGHSYSDFSHGIDFTDSAGTNRLQVFENGNDRGLVGANPGYTAGSIYRIKITLDSAGANSAKYEIQGGPEYDPIGGATWDDITPGTTSSSTTPVYAGATVSDTVDNTYIGDVKIY